MKLGDLKIGIRLFTGFCIVLAVFGLAELFTSISVREMERNSLQLADERLPHALLAESMAFNIVKAQQFLTDVAATRDPKGLREAEEAAAGFRQGAGTLREMFTVMLTQLVPDIQRTAELVQEISAASSEQTSGADQINNAIQQLNQVVQQNAGATEEIASTAEELAAQAEQLKTTIAFFRVAESGAKPASKRSEAGLLSRTTHGT